MVNNGLQNSGPSGWSWRPFCHGMSHTPTLAQVQEWSDRKQQWWSAGSMAHEPSNIIHQAPSSNIKMAGLMTLISCELCVADVTCCFFQGGGGVCRPSRIERHQSLRSLRLAYTFLMVMVVVGESCLSQDDLSFMVRVNLRFIGDLKLSMAHVGSHSKARNDTPG